MSSPHTGLRKAGNSDAAALESFLCQHAETSMFLRGNLAEHGLEASKHHHATTYWVKETQGIDAVIACTNGGYLMCQAPGVDAGFWVAAAAAIRGRSIQGITGVPLQVNAWASALGLVKDELFSLKKTEPLYRLALSDLLVPDLTGLQLRRPKKSDFAMLVEWFEGYAQDTGITPSDGASSDFAAAVFCDHEAARILECDGQAVAMTSLNARAAETVQIGGVYVPTAQRGRGLAGAAVAAQLSELRTASVKTAILFAASRAAARAYERIGFLRVGDYEIALLNSPYQVKGSQDVL